VNRQWAAMIKTADIRCRCSSVPLKLRSYRPRPRTALASSPALILLAPVCWPASEEKAPECQGAFRASSIRRSVRRTSAIGNYENRCQAACRDTPSTLPMVAQRTLRARSVSTYFFRKSRAERDENRRLSSKVLLDNSSKLGKLGNFLRRSIC
jgi:hypothetical protein